MIPGKKYLYHRLHIPHIPTSYNRVPIVMRHKHRRPCIPIVILVIVLEGTMVFAGGFLGVWYMESHSGVVAPGAWVGLGDICWSCEVVSARDCWCGSCMWDEYRRGVRVDGSRAGPAWDNVKYCTNCHHELSSNGPDFPRLEIRHCWGVQSGFL